MTVEYSRVRRRVPASLFTLSLLSAFAAQPAAANEAAATAVGADGAAAHAESGGFGSKIG